MLHPGPAISDFKPFDGFFKIEMNDLFRPPPLLPLTDTCRFNILADTKSLGNEPLRTRTAERSIMKLEHTVRKIRIQADDITVEGILFDTNTARALWAALPIEGTVNTWGDEIYFSTGLGLDLENGVEEVNSGDIGFWPTGKAVCLFFGPTPIQAQSPCSVKWKGIRRY
jgi:hypothetical protein